MTVPVGGFPYLFLPFLSPIFIGANPVGRYRMRLDDDRDFATACRELALRCRSGFISYPITILALLFLSPRLRLSLWSSAIVFGVFLALVVVRTRLCRDILELRGSISPKTRTLFDTFAVCSAALWSVYIGYIGVVGEQRTVCIALISSVGLGAGAITSLAADHRLYLKYFTSLTTPSLIVLWLSESPNLALYASVYLALAVVAVLVNRNTCRNFWSQVHTEREHLEEVRELRQRVEQAEKLRTLGVLAGGVAHDFNNFLTSLVGNIDLALLDIERTSPAHECLEEAKQSVFKASELCDQLLAYAGKAEAHIEEFNLNDLLLEMSHFLQVSMGKNVELQLHLEADAPAVLGDPNQIRQVLLNLFTNAAESMAHKAGTIRVSSASVTKAETSLFHPDLKPRPYLCLSITDEGSGMNQDVVDKIYDPFFTTKFTGRGLGLASVQGIIRGHEGKIKVKSTSGTGTTFQVFLPASETTVTSRLREHSILLGILDNYGERGSPNLETAARFTPPSGTPRAVVSGQAVGVGI